MANKSLIEKLLKRQEEETKVEVELKGLADTPFYVKLNKELYKELEEEAEQSQGDKEVSRKVFVERLDALVVVRSLYDHNEEPVFTGELYEALGTWDAVEVVKKVSRWQRNKSFTRRQRNASVSFDSIRSRRKTMH